jgi:hypothetical protein
MTKKRSSFRVAMLFTLLQFVSYDSFAETLTDTPEVQRLKVENKELRQKLAAAERKIQSLSAKAAPMAAPPTSTPKIATEITTERTELVTFLDKIFVRKSVFSEDQLSPDSISEPAQFTFQHLGHGSDSYAIDSGIAATFISALVGQAQIDWGVGADYHRNSSADSPEDLFQAGLVADSIFGNAATSDFFVRAKANLSYKDDIQKDQEAVASGFDLLPVARLLWIDNYHRLGPAHWRWQPFVGLRWEVTAEAPAGAASGDQVLARYGVETQIFPLFDYIQRSLEATLTLTAWSNIHSSGLYTNKNWRGYLDANLTYWFTGGLSRGKQKANLGFGLEYENGDNPDLDRTNVDLLTISLKAKF